MLPTVPLEQTVGDLIKYILDSECDYFFAIDAYNVNVINWGEDVQKEEIKNQKINR